MRLKNITVAAAIMTGLLAFAPGASAQFGNLGKTLKDRAKQEVQSAVEDKVAEALFPVDDYGSDVRLQSPQLDGIDFGPFADMATLERTADGGFKLKPGAWTFTAQAYCLKPGSYERTGGAGLMSGRLHGKLAEPIRTALKNSYRHPEIAQDDIQVLFWSMIAGVEIKHMTDGARHAAKVLLTAQQYRDLDGGALGWVPPELSAKARSRLPQAAREALDASERLRARASQSHVAYGDLEAIAVRKGEPPRTDDDVPSGRWSWHPAGFHIRYSGQSYRNAKVEIIVGEKLTVMRDALGRITEMRLPDGAYLRAGYRDDVEPLRIKKIKGWAAYAFSFVEMGAPVDGVMQTKRVDNEGFAWVSDHGARKTDAAPLLRYAALDDGVRSDAAPMRLAQVTVIDITEARERYDSVADRYEYYGERWGNATRPTTDDDLDAVMDQDHYREGAETVFGDTGDRVDWIGRTHERLARALARATDIIGSLGEDDDSPTYEPSDEVALPSRSGYVQQRGLAGLPIAH